MQSSVRSVRSVYHSKQHLTSSLLFKQSLPKCGSHSHTPNLHTVSVRTRWNFQKIRQIGKIKWSEIETGEAQSKLTREKRKKEEDLGATQKFEELFNKERSDELMALEQATKERSLAQKARVKDDSGDEDYDEDDDLDHSGSEEEGSDDEASEDEDERYAPLVMTDEKGRVRFQRNIPGKPTVYEGFEVKPLIRPKRRRGRVHFRDWHTCRQAVLRCPSAMQGRMPLRKEVSFIFPRLRKAINVHGGWSEVARRLGLKPHRVPPYYIPYLSEEEQYEFVAKSIQKNNALRRHT